MKSVANRLNLLTILDVCSINKLKKVDFWKAVEALMIQIGSKWVFPNRGLCIPWWLCLVCVTDGKATDKCSLFQLCVLWGFPLLHLLREHKITQKHCRKFSWSGPMCASSVTTEVRLFPLKLCSFFSLLPPPPGFCWAFHQPVQPGMLQGQRAALQWTSQFCFEWGPSFLHPVCVGEKWTVSMEKIFLVFLQYRS